MTVLNPRPAPSIPGTGVQRRPVDDVITQLPVLILYPHSRCNCRCLMCDIWRAAERDQLSADEIAKWSREWKRMGVERVVLSGGEALLHAELWTICDTLKAAGIGISILSTGLLLERHAAELVQRCDDVVVSLDGPAPVHDAIRNVPRAFERLVDGVRAIKALSSSTVVSARCTVQKENIHVLRDTVRAAHSVGFDRISFLAADVHSSAFNRPGGWTSERVATVAPDSADLHRLEEELDALELENAADFASGFIAESPLKLRVRLLDYFRAVNGVGDFAPNECNAPWVSAVIEADGAVRPCFFHPAVGNVREQPLEQIINSEHAVAWRRNLDVTKNEICRKCVCTLSLRTTA